LMHEAGSRKHEAADKSVRRFLCPSHEEMKKRRHASIA